MTTVTTLSLVVNTFFHLLVEKLENRCRMSVPASGVARPEADESAWRNDMKYGGSDGSKSRITRLEKVQRLVGAILGLSDEQVEMLILEMYDHKGQLNVVWNNTKPTPMQKAAFSKAWELCAECPTEVYHCVNELWSEDV